jgi:hypothetical protein
VVRGFAHKGAKARITLAQGNHHGGNVILLPMANKAEQKAQSRQHQQKQAMAMQPLLFAGHELPDMPPWLIEKTPETKSTPVAKESKPRKSRAKPKTAAKLPKTTRTATPKKKPAARKTKPKATVAKTIITDTPVAETPIIVQQSIAVEALAAPSLSQPLARSAAPAVWRKEGPVDIVRFWLRSAGRTVVSLFGKGKKQAARIEEPYGAKLRTRKALLNELAILREENAKMREKLDLPAMPFGRQVADHL